LYYNETSLGDNSVLL